LRWRYQDGRFYGLQVRVFVDLARAAQVRDGIFMRSVGQNTTGLPVGIYKSDEQVQTAVNKGMTRDQARKVHTSFTIRRSLNLAALGAFVGAVAGPDVWSDFDTPDEPDNPESRLEA